ncbi:hypothetical protein DL1_09105 [Thioclava dalianensis]|uniref:Polysaccharide biosynthesis protein n=2 Tax=Thioclava dalianensis TaxID=1185766 RepID=A0A074TIC7_9RHOB|nr:hypothetical protein DL1_09105 [Thioclava dalianensis]SFN59242.1 Membrane protein involved in the export of O-antigen and teichoic acid [Thioclava dalianensis]
MMTERRQETQRPVGLRRLMGLGMLGQLSFVASQFLLLAGLARFGQLEDVGQFGLVSAIILPIYWFFNLGIRANQATDHRVEYGFACFLALRIPASLLAYAIIVGIAFLWLDPLARQVMLGFGAAKGIETLSELCYGAFQRADRMADVARSLALRGMGGAALFWAMLGAGATPAAGFGALACLWAVVALGLDLPRAWRLAQRDTSAQPRPSLRQVADLARASLPLGITGALAALQGATPRYVIAHVLGLAALGQFMLVGYAMQAVTTLSNALGQSIMARLAYYDMRGDRAAFVRVLARVLGVIALASLGAALGAALWGDLVLAALFGAGYGALGDLLALVFGAAGISAAATILQTGLLARRRFSTILRLRALSVISVVCLAGAGALWLGLAGVVCGIALAAALHALMLWRALQEPRHFTEEIAI